LQEGAVELQQAVYQPFILLTEEEKGNLLPESIEGKVRILARLTPMRDETSDERERRLSRLLEHLERRISDKRASVNFNRATMLSLIAISISLLTLIVIVILYFI
jgi:hypothetical protein